MRKFKRNVLLGLTIGALLALAAWTQVWFTFDVSEGAAVSQVTVAGTESRPFVSALALGTLAAIGALLLAGNVARLLILLVTIGLGVGGVISASSASQDPIAASLAPLSAVTGLDDVGTVTAAVTAQTQTAGWIVCSFGFFLIFLSALAGAVTHRKWQRPTDRFNRPESDAEFRSVKTDHISDGDSWDSLSRGEDPTR